MPNFKGNPISGAQNMKHIIRANMNVKLYSWPFTFRKVVRQQILGEVLVLIPSLSADHFWILQWKEIMKIGPR